MPKQFTTVLSFALAMLLLFSTQASAMYTTYQAKIIKPDGTPLESTSVNFRFTILDPLGACILYTENFNTINMAGSGGLVYFPLGSGIKTFPTSGTVNFSDVFNNYGAALSCAAGGPPSYSPTANDLRKIVMQFHDGSGWQTLPAMNINHVPYAMYAKNAASATTAINSAQLNGKTDLDFVQVSAIPACAVSQALQFNGASFSCVSVSGGGGGGSITVSGTAPIIVTGTVSSPQISISVASMSSDGYLTAADYAEFKAKLSASGTEITNTLGFAPVSAAAVATQIAAAAAVSNTANALVLRDSSGNIWANDVYSNTAKTNYVDIFKPSTAFSIRLQAPTSLSASYNLIFPSDDGLNGQVLTTDGSGNLSWVSQTQTITSSDVVTALGYTPAASGSFTSSQWNTSGTTINYMAGNVGIGTTNPSQSLQVNGNVRANTFMVDAQASVSSSAAAGGDDLGLFAGNVERVTITNTGNVGIGTTTPAGKLDIQGNLNAGTSNSLGADSSITAGRSNSASGYDAIAVGFGNTASGDQSVALGQGNSAMNTGSIALGRLNTSSGIGSSAFGNSTIANSYGSFVIGRYNIGGGSPGSWVSTDSVFEIGIGTGTGASAANALTVLKNGNVGIGTTTPRARLDVSGSVVVGNLAANDAALTIYTQDSGSVSHGIVLIDKDAGYGSWQNPSGLDGIDADSSGTVTGWGQLYLNYYSTSDINFNNGGGDSRFNGRVGIGTTPTAKLHIAGGTSSTAALKFVSGTLLAAPQTGAVEYNGFNLYITDGTGTRRAIATTSSSGTIDNVNNINASTNMTLTPVGSVVVSATTASTNSNTGALVVKGGLGVAGNINAAGSLNVSGSSVIDGSLKLSSMTSGSVLFAGANGTVTQNNSSLYWDGANKRLGIGSNSPVQTLSVSGASYFSGNVGIGTTAPTSSLHLNTGLSTTNYTGVKIENSFKTWTIGNNLPNSYNNIFSIYDGTTSRLWITDTGNVGIGTTTPTAKLVVATTLDGLPATTGSTDANVAFRITSNTNSQLDFGSTSSNNNVSWIQSRDALNFALNRPLVFNPNGGNVGIGTVTPAYKFSLYDGAGSVVANVESGNNGSAAYTRTTGKTSGGVTRTMGVGLNISDSNGNFELYDFTAGTSRLYVNDVGFVGIGTTAPATALHVVGDIQYTGTITDVSDRRLKTNIEPLDSALTTIRKIKTYSYVMKDDPKARTEYGVMAQDMLGIIPNLVKNIDTQGEYYGVNYMGLIPWSIRALQEVDSETLKLRHENSEIKREIASLKEKNEVLEQKLEKILQALEQQKRHGEKK